MLVPTLTGGQQSELIGLSKNLRRSSVLCHKNELNVFLGGFIVFVFSYTSLSLSLQLSHQLSLFRSGRQDRSNPDERAHEKAHNAGARSINY